MKLAVVIVCLTAIAVGVVHFRRERTHLGNEIERLQKRQETLREDLWRQQARMASLMEPAAIRSRAQDLEIPSHRRAREYPFIDRAVSLMKNDSPGKWRLQIVFGLLVLAMGGLGYRLYQLVVYNAEAAERKAERQEVLTVSLPGKPGSIYIHGHRAFVPIAESRQVPSVYADPNMIGEANLPGTVVQLGKALKIDPNHVKQTILARSNRRFVWVQREVGDLEANAVLALRLPGVGVDYEWRRMYPSGQLAGQVIGFPVADANVASGQWNHFRITANDNWITVDLNGKQVAKADLNLWMKPGVNPDGSHNKYPYAAGALPHEGFLLLQNYGGAPVWFRNVRLKPLSDRQPGSDSEPQPQPQPKPIGQPQPVGLGGERVGQPQRQPHALAGRPDPADHGQVR